MSKLLEEFEDNGLLVDALEDVARGGYFVSISNDKLLVMSPHRDVYPQELAELLSEQYYRIEEWNRSAFQFKIVVIYIKKKGTT